MQAALQIYVYFDGCRVVIYPLGLYELQNNGCGLGLLLEVVPCC